MIRARARRAIPSYLVGKMARHSASSLAIKLFAIGCAFLFALIVARTLGASGYGVVAFAISVATVSSTLALRGINGLAVRVIATFYAQREMSKAQEFIIWSTRTVLLLSIAVGALVALGSLVEGPYRTGLVMAALAVPLLSQLSLKRGITQGTGNIVGAQVPLDVVRWVVTLAILAAIVVAGFAISIAAALGAVLVSLGVGVLVARLLARRELALPANAKLSRAHSGWGRDALPFLGIAFLGIVGTEINTLLLGLLAGPREAGLYQPIARLAPIMILAREALDMPLAPRIIQLWEAGDLPGLRRLVRRSALACTAATTAICAALLLASPWIFAAFGPEFLAYRVYLYWIAGAQLINAIFSPAPVLLTMVGSMKDRVRAQVATLVVQAGLAFALVPRFGVPGAVTSLTCAIVVWSLLHWLIARSTTGIDASAFSFSSKIRRSKT